MLQLIVLIFIGFVIFIVCGILGWILKAFYYLLTTIGEGFSGCLGCLASIVFVIFTICLVISIL